MATNVKNSFGRVKKAAKKAEFKNLGHAGATIRRIASRSIRMGKKPSASGTPPRTRKGALRKSILYAVDESKGSVIVGPSADLVGPVGGTHERGGPFRGGRYPARPFMVPALEKVIPQIPEMWRDSIREN
jgi:hypothetical protein